jgi:hypothetical protein
MPLLLVGCAGPAAWDKLGATPEEFMADRAQCELLAEGANPDLNIGAIETGKLKRDVAANIGAGIAEGVVRGAGISHTFSLCMQAKGYIPISRGVLAAILAAKPIFAETNACISAVRASPEAQLVLDRDPMDPKDLTAEHLSDPTFPTDAQSKALADLHQRIAACQAKTIAELSASAAAPVAPLFEATYAENARQVQLLEDRKITWGQFNTSRKERGEVLLEKIKTAIVTGEAPTP